MNTQEWKPCRLFRPHFVGFRPVLFVAAERRWNWNLNWWGDFSGHAGTDGGWEYRMKDDAAMRQERGNG